MMTRTRISLVLIASLALTVAMAMQSHRMSSASAQDMGRTYASPDGGMSEEQSSAIWEALEQSHWIRDGDPDAPRIVYTFTDPNCPYCHQFWEKARPWVEAGDVQLRHIMVGILADDSASKAAFLFEADDPQQALNAHSSQQEPAKAESHTGDARRQVHENNQLFGELGLAATPTSVAKENGRLLPVPGLPQGQRLELLMEGL